MAVRVSPLNILAAGGAPVVNTFSDNFNRAGTNLGSSWMSCGCPFTPVVGPQPDFVTAFIPGTNDRMSFGVGAAGVNSTWTVPLMLWPRVVSQSLFNSSQFSQITFLALTNFSNGGPGVLMNDLGAASFSNYGLTLENAGGNISLTRTNGSVASLVHLITNVTTVANGDVLRLSADISNGGQVTLTVKKNGVFVNSFVDNGGAQIRSGVPGMQCVGCSTNPAGGSDWDNFSCGPGL